MSIDPGWSTPLGATWDGSGVGFAVFSEPAERIELCLFNPDGSETRHTLPEINSSVHHGYIAGVKPGQEYGFRVHGEWNPAAGILCNPAKLLVDPYARAVTGQIRWGPEVYSHHPDDPDIADPRDSAAYMPRAVVVDPTFDWGDDRPPNHPLIDSVIYETHVRGMTIRHPDVPEPFRGTFAGMACAPILEHLTDLGITAVELLPVHQFLTEHPIAQRGLTNYWGYSPLAPFAPHGAYSSVGDAGGQVAEFKAMVRSFHEAGIEVLLDVVYNHTVEGNHEGPHLSLKGFDNAAYYRLDPGDPSRHLDFTGTGNSVDTVHPRSLQLVLDSLRFWVLEMHVDGFRFDLATTLGRGPDGFDPGSEFFEAIRRDPVLSRVKLIAEPWDLGPDGYQAGNFPIGWSEWNGRFRDDVRDYWCGNDGSLPNLASRFAGSSDLYPSQDRGPATSINFVTAHDGFTLADLVSYDDKHNEANGEDNADGDSHNRSWNSGLEGPTTDPGILAVRSTRLRSMLATVVLSQGVPMLLGGDEMGRTQGGNNNGFAQDNEVSWVDWAHVDHDLAAFVGRLLRLRAGHSVFRRQRWFDEPEIGSDGPSDIGWFDPAGAPMTVVGWAQPDARSLAVHLDGTAPPPDPDGDAAPDDHFLLLFNARPDPTTFSVPAALENRTWSVAIDTASATGDSTPGRWEVAPWALVVLQSGGS